jgi:hypothetical protein
VHLNNIQGKNYIFGIKLEGSSNYSNLFPSTYTKILYIYISNYASTHPGDGQNNGNTRQYRNKIVCVGCSERILYVRFFHYSFVCLHCVAPASLHYRLCLVTIHMKVLQNGKLVRFSKRTDCWCVFSCSICKQNGHFIRCITAAVSKAMMAYKNHWKTSSAKRNSGQKPKLSERESHTLKRSMSENHRTTAAKYSKFISSMTQHTLVINIKN